MGAFPNYTGALWAPRMREKGPLTALIQLPSDDLCSKLASSKVRRGSISCRKDRADKPEWQFSLRKSLAWTEEETKHGYKGENSTKAEAAQWLELKAQGLLEGDAQSPNQKLARRMSCPEVLGQKKQHLAIEYGKPSEDEEESGAGSTKGKDGQVVEAEVLFEMGRSVHKKEACLRITRMVKLLKDIKKRKLEKRRENPWMASLAAW